MKFPIPPSLLNVRVTSSSGVSLCLTKISPIFLEYLQIGYFLSFLGVIVSFPILYPFFPVLIFPMVISFFLCLALDFFSVDFLFAVFSFFEIYPFSPGRMFGVLIAMKVKRKFVL